MPFGRDRGQQDPRRDPEVQGAAGKGNAGLIRKGLIRKTERRARERPFQLGMRNEELRTPQAGAMSSEARYIMFAQQIHHVAKGDTKK